MTKTNGSRHKWNEDQFRAAVAESESYAQVARKLGLAVAGGTYNTIKRYVAIFDLDVSHFTGKAWVGTRPFVPSRRYTLEEIFSEDSQYSTNHLLPILLREGYRERRCENCREEEWRGNPIPLEVDHINGKRTDHRLENIRLLCPNCHALTDTWRGRNNKRLKAA